MRDHSGMRAQLLSLSSSSLPAEAEIRKGLDQMGSRLLLVAAYCTVGSNTLVVLRLANFEPLIATIAIVLI
jgi:hypothetical protein